MRALESVLGQRFDRLQLVIALMPSADRTRAIAERAAERNIRIELVDVDDVHVAAAFDAGLAVARGDYVLFMHADDWFGPRALETLLKVAEEGDLDFALPLWVGDALGMPAALAEDTDARLYRTASEVSSAADFKYSSEHRSETDQQGDSLQRLSHSFFHCLTDQVQRHPCPHSDHNRRDHHGYAAYNRM